MSDQDHERSKISYVTDQLTYLTFSFKIFHLSVPNCSTFEQPLSYYTYNPYVGEGRDCLCICFVFEAN